ncbi:TonB-dependent receptor plug domain-containing protein [Marinicellulosiphila megalodicopiae]|uniref:TonB-dependent receptor plug domain-containing protein n=1 Tax=Marinicellulosiphila megalodicopiae TaxID=2724896 RepID=UPI003BB17577
MKSSHLSALLIPFSALCHAYDLGDVTIQADKTGVPIHLSNLNVEVINITSDSISLQDVLQKSGSIDTYSMHGQDGTAVNLNGMDSNHVLITLDGLAINPSGQAVNLNDINMANILRIEIIKGNASSQYGSQALGGVINLVSKPTASSALPSGSVHYKTHKQHTSILGDTSAQIHYAQSINDLNFSHHVQVNNYSQSQLNKESNESEQSSGYRILLNEKISKENLTLQTQLNIKRLTRPFEYQVATNTIDKHKIENENRGFLQLNYNKKDWQASSKYQYLNAQSIQDVISTTDSNDFNREITSHFIQANVQKNIEFTTASVLVGAFSHAESLEQIKEETKRGITTLTNELSETQNKSSIELYAQHDWYLSDYVSLQSGLRVQFDSDFGVFNSPNMAIRWDVNANNIIKASTGIGYRVPDLKERHFIFDHSIYGYEVIGNKDLTPETSFSSQLQWQYITHNFDLSHTLYAHYLDDLIEQTLDDSIDNGIDSYININNGKASIIGIDSQIKWTGNDALDLSWSTNLLQATYLIDQTKMINKPNKKIKADAKWKLKNNQFFTTQIAWQSDAINSVLETKPDVVLVNVSWQQDLSKTLSMNVALNNLTNQIKNPEITGDSRPNSGLELAVHISFNP